MSSIISKIWRNNIFNISLKVFGVYIGYSFLDSSNQNTIVDQDEEINDKSLQTEMCLLRNKRKTKIKSKKAKNEGIATKPKEIGMGSLQEKNEFPSSKRVKKEKFEAKPKEGEKKIDESPQNYCQNTCVPTKKEPISSLNSEPSSTNIDNNNEDTKGFTRVGSHKNKGKAQNQIKTLIEPKIETVSLRNGNPSSQQWFQYDRVYERGVCGLQNLGNTCYMNSALQCLSNIEILTKFCHKFKQRRQGGVTYFNRNNYLIDIYCKLNESLWSGQSNNVSPRDFKSRVSQLFTRFSGWGQNDCSELLTSVLSHFHEELLQIESGRRNDFTDYDSYEEYLQNNNTFIAQNFHGYQRFQLSCDCTQLLIEKYDPFVVLNLPQNVTRPTKSIVYLIRNSDQWTHNLLKIELHFQTNEVLVRDLIEKLRQAVQRSQTEQSELYRDNLIVTEMSGGQITNFFAPEVLLNLNELKNRIFIFEKDPEFPEQVFVELNNKKSGPFGIPLLLDINDRDIESIKIEFHSKFAQNLNLSPRPSEQESKAINNIEIISKTSESVYNILIAENISQYIVSKYRNPLNNNNRYDNCIYSQRSEYDPYLRLEQNLDNYISKRKMNSNDKLYCSECQTDVSPIEQISVVFPPNVLILQLKTNPNLQSYSSENIGYEFPLVLNFNKYVLNFPQNKDLFYDLIAISNYSGSAYSGHYTAYAKNFQNNKWYDFNDSYVSDINSPEIRSTRAYLLFYIKRNK